MRRLLPLVALVLIVEGVAGCAFTRSDFGSFTRAGDGDITGSIKKTVTPTDSDLAFVRTAASDVLNRGTRDSSQHWENPETGAHGSVTPIGEVYRAETGKKCRDFLASHVNGRAESWLRGAGCQGGRGNFEVITLKVSGLNS
ncbi:MAG: RT0821/Lpp0805 family surface protein [Alphaproteobacteria bacterium]|nr:RT0821/Lpp0805 family surface protein [Alphaproteobacteria bacterium]